MKGALRPNMLMPRPLAVCIARILGRRLPMPILIGFVRGNA